MPCRANVSRIDDAFFARLRLLGCEDETEPAIIEPSVPCWPVSGDGNPYYERHSNQHIGRYLGIEHLELT